MDIVGKDKAPSISVVLPYFVIAAFAFFVMTVILFFHGDHFLLSHFYLPQTLAFTHLTVLGWITMIIMGALYQLTPVIFEVSLYSERLAKLNLGIYSIGVIMMVYAFWIGHFGMILSIASIIVLIAVIIFAVNILMSIKRSLKQSYSSKFIKSGMYWLLSTGVVGVVLALNHQYDLFDNRFPDYIRLHAHIGIIGWLLQLIIGVSTVLFPMFLISHNLDEKKLERSFLWINLGLGLLIVSWFFPPYMNVASYVFILAIIVGIGFYISYLRDAYREKLRPLDIGMLLSTVSMISIGLPILLGIGFVVMMVLKIGITPLLFTTYGMAIFLAFITPMILGQTYKTLPFIVWLHYYQKFVGKKKILMPADLFDIRVAHIHLWTFVIGIVVVFLGLGLSNIAVLKIGFFFLLVTALLYLYNVLKMVLHRPDTEMETISVDLSQSVLEVLKQVIDPEVEINIVDLGLIYKVDEEDDNSINIDMTLSTPSCPIADSIVMNVMEIVQTAYPDYQVNVNLVFDPPWNPSLISDEGRKHLDDTHKWFQN